MRLDVKESRELLATIYAIRSLDKTIAKMVRRETKIIAAPAWKKALAHHSLTRLENRVLVDTATVTVSNQNVRVQSAMKGRPLSGGLNPKTDWHAIEFGGDQNRVERYRSHRGNTRFNVTRHTTHQVRAANRPRGYVFYRTAREMIPRLASLWVQTTVRTIATAFEGKQE